MVYPIISLTPELLPLGLTKYVTFYRCHERWTDTGFVFETPAITKNADVSEHIENVL
jgi:hypothetical protein